VQHDERQAALRACAGGTVVDLAYVDPDKSAENFVAHRLLRVLLCRQ
jgi:hypothetical protein